MNAHSPILVAGPARAGTTMVAGLVMYHGVWIGESRVTRAPETNPLVGTENVHIKKYLRGIPSQGHISDFKNEVLHLVKTQDRWLVKTAQLLLKWRHWNKHFPDAKWLLTMRSPEAIVKSAMSHPGMKNKGESYHERRVQILQMLQDEVEKKCANSHRINVGAMAGGDKEVSRKAIEFCNLDFDQDVWKNWIDPDRWHHGN